MANYNVVFKEGNSTCKSTYTVAASSEAEAVDKWKNTIAGKTGRCQMVIQSYLNRLYSIFSINNISILQYYYLS